MRKLATELFRLLLVACLLLLPLPTEAGELGLFLHYQRQPAPSARTHHIHTDTFQNIKATQGFLFTLLFLFLSLSLSLVSSVFIIFLFEILFLSYLFSLFPSFRSILFV